MTIDNNLIMVKCCETCNQEYFRKYREGIKRFLSRKYCSLKCRQIWNKGVKGKQTANSGSFKKGQESSMKGKHHTEESKEKNRLAHIGKKTKPCTLETKIKISNAQKGEKSHLWKGGKTEENKLIRMSLEYRIWRESVFKRDNYICQKCNIKGGELQAHHIKEFAKYPDLRFDINNGLTLCKPCHKETDSYGVN